jgi:hypothetical protein
MTAFTIVNGAALPPLPFEDASELVQLNVRNVTDARGVDLSGDERPARRVAAAFVSWDAFSMLAQRPVAGRDFRESDDRAGAPPVVIIGWSLWQARYGGDQAIVGRTLRVNGVPSTIVGVMPEHFGFPYRVEFWLPLVALPESDRASRDAP